MERVMPDDDLRTMGREFRESVATDLEPQHKRLDDLSDEVRRRIATAEAAIVNEIRDLSGRLDRRLERVEQRMDSVEGRLGSVEGRLGSVEGRLDAVERRLAGE
jgi:hypothetical protein